MVGGFLALWTIGYGVVQALAPALVRRSADGLSSRGAGGALVVGGARAGAGGAGRCWWPLDVPHLEWVVVGGLGVFGFAFAVNSSVHSYLMLAYAGSEKAAEDVGFYYAANAAGPLLRHAAVGPAVPVGRPAVCAGGLGASMLVACWLVDAGLPPRQPRRCAQPPDRDRPMNEKAVVRALAALAQQCACGCSAQLVGAGPQGMTPGALAADAGRAGLDAVVPPEGAAARRPGHAGARWAPPDLPAGASGTMNELLGYLQRPLLPGRPMCA